MPLEAPPFRLLLFGDPYLRASIVLAGAALRAAATRPDLEVIGLVDATRRAPGASRIPRTLAARAARRACNPRSPVDRDDLPLLTTLASLAKGHGVPLLAPRELGLNEPAFLERVRELRPDASLALMVSQIFQPPLLEACRAPANYHNGFLPAYRGVGATEWGVYHGTALSGFSYHRMSERIDEGPILLQGGVAASPEAVPATLERAKTALAAEKIETVVEMLVEGQPGIPQEGPASIYTRADLAAMRDVGDPSQLTWDELERRVRAFDHVALSLAGERWDVTALRRFTIRAWHPELAFTTADGVRAEPARCVHLPVSLYRAYRPLREAVSEA